MKAAVYRRFGGPDVVHVEHIADLEPKADELLIRVHASTVSAADYRSRSRDIPAGLALPSSLVLGFFRPRRPVLGMEAAGIVERHSFEGRTGHFEAAAGHHDHLVDAATGEAIEFSDPELEALQERIALRLGYRLTRHHLTLFGEKLP